MAKETKEKIRALYNKAKTREAELASASKEQYITDGQFRFGNNAAFIDIKLSKNVKQLRDIVAFLDEKSAYVESANKKLGIDEPFEWQGASVENWTSDVILRVTQLKLVERKAELQKIKDNLLKMDTSLLAEIELEEMEKLLQD